MFSFFQDASNGQDSTANAEEAGGGKKGKRKAKNQARKQFNAVYCCSKIIKGPSFRIAFFSALMGAVLMYVKIPVL